MFFPGSSQPECVAITIVDDLLDEDNETFTVAVSSQTGNVLQSITITIVDDGKMIALKQQQQKIILTLSPPFFFLCVQMLLQLNSNNRNIWWMKQAAAFRFVPGLTVNWEKPFLYSFQPLMELPQVLINQLIFSVDSLHSNYICAIIFQGLGSL